MDVKLQILVLLFLVLCYSETGQALKRPIPGGNRNMGFDIGARSYQNGTSKLKCMGEDINTNLLMDAYESCKTEMDHDGEFLNIRSLCFTVCVWRNIGLVGEDMYFTQDTSEFVLGTFPTSAQSQIIKALTKCANNNKWPASKNNNCRSYGSMRKCMMDAVVSICRG